MTDGWNGAERRASDGLIEGLTDAIAGLSGEVKGLREEVGQVDAKRKRNLLWLIPLAALTFYGVYDRDQIKDLAERERKTSLATAVGVCAMQNVIRIELNNFLSVAQNEGIFDEPFDTPEARAATAKRRAFLSEGRKKFELVPCEALVAGENVEIRLEYPSTIPVTSVP